MPLNMKKEIRAEIKTLKGALKKVGRDFRLATRQLVREHQQHKSAMRRIEIQIERSQPRLIRETGKINRRILILEGRLA